MDRPCRDSFLARFRSTFNCEPEIIIRAPGRVNLIGEHTDYSLLPVLPLAIDRATWVAGAAAQPAEVIASSLRFDETVRLDRRGTPLGTTPSWHRYLTGALLQLQGLRPERGARLLIDGDLPLSGGLSSSSSFTMGLLAALDRLWELGLGTEELVRRGIVSERHVGVESGGMDQTVIAWAVAGAALRIDFAPPARRPVAVPADLAMAVAYSGQEAPKGGAVRQAYNERVIACRLAAALLARESGLDAGDPPRLGAVARWPEALAAAERLPERASPAATARQLGILVEPLARLTASHFDPDTEVLLRSAARHVLSEAARVDQAERALLASDFTALGELLDGSHRSLARDYACSTPALDELCAAMRSAGAWGARLTGAGFGGYAIAACPRDRLDAVLEAARRTTGGPAFPVRAMSGLETATLSSPKLS